jgi:alpha-mannosidase
VGWQIDPFGHSALSATLLGPQVGFEGIFLGRADYADLAQRIEARDLEFRWRPSGGGDGDDAVASASAAASASFVGMILGSGNYGPPPGFDWDVSRAWRASQYTRPDVLMRGCITLSVTDVLACTHTHPPSSFFSGDPPINDDPLLEGYNVASVVDAFVNTSLTWAQRFRGASPSSGGDVMFTMGSDFNYQAAGMWFTNLDKLIAALGADGRVNAFYSTPATYLDAKKSTSWGAAAADTSSARDSDAAGGLMLKTDDLFPYADGPHAYWTGYYTSRPALKRLIRGASGYLAAARQLALLAGGGAGGAAAARLSHLEDALATAQHHDAVAGTSKQHVADDYAQRLCRGTAEAARGVADAMRALLSMDENEDAAPQGAAAQAALSRRHLRSDADATPAAASPAASPAPTPAPAPAPAAAAVECPLLNVSLCPATEALRVGGPSLTLSLWNPLGWPHTALVRVPIPAAAPAVAVAGPGGAALPAQVMPASAETAALRARYREYTTDADTSANALADARLDADADEPRELLFEAALPALGYASFSLTAFADAADAPLTVFTPEMDAAADEALLGGSEGGKGGAMGVQVDAAGQVAALSAEVRLFGTAMQRAFSCISSH